MLLVDHVDLLGIRLIVGLLFWSFVVLLLIMGYLVPMLFRVEDGAVTVVMFYTVAVCE